MPKRAQQGLYHRMGGKLLSRYVGKYVSWYKIPELDMPDQNDIDNCEVCWSGVEDRLL